MRLVEPDSRWQVVFVCGRQNGAAFFVLQNCEKPRGLRETTNHRVLYQIGTGMTSATAEE